MSPLLKFKKWPSKSQWRQLLKILSKKEKVVFFVFLFLFFASFLSLVINFYLKNTEVVPTPGGFYTEGIVGSPRWINPLYATANDPDRDLVELIYSGLMKYDGEGKIVPDLAKEYEILEGGKVYEFYLKENLFWSGGKALTADDIIFTIESVQNPDLKSPLRANWLGVEVEKISDREIRFELKNPYAPFLENTTLKIIPKHIWQDIAPQNFPLAVYNLKPVGSGPYKLKTLNQDKEGKIISLTLNRNPYYFNKTPNLKEISFKFFGNEEDLIKAYRKGEIEGISLTSLNNLPNLSKSTNLYSFSLPRYFAVFFNPDKSKTLAETEVRQALNYGTNKEEIIEKVLGGKGKVAQSPILPEVYGFNLPEKNYQFDLEKAKELLDKAGFVENEEGIREKFVKKEPAFQLKSNLKVGSQGQEIRELQKCLSGDPEIYPEGEITGYFGEKTKTAVIKFQEKYKDEILKPQGLEKGTGEVLKATRNKLNEVCFKPSEETLPLKFSLITVDQPQLMKVAFQLKEQWLKLGVEIEIKTFDVSAIEREIIKPRNYEAILFGEALGAIPDPFPFWHSSQKKDPGLNLASYENKKCDTLLKEARETLNREEREEKLEAFQTLLIDDAPAVFLYNPDYLYLVPKEIKGINAKIIIDPSKRFSDVENWYIETKRVWE